MELLKTSDFGWHAEQPDVPQKSAAQMKAFLDAPTHTLMQKVNELVAQINTLVADENSEGSVAYDIQKAIGAVTDFNSIVEYLEQNGAEAEGLLGAVADLQEQMKVRADYVCETGSDGVWSYRKWAGGTYEAWCYYETSITLETWGNVYGCDVYLAAPSFSKTVTNCFSDNTVVGTMSWGAANISGNACNVRFFSAWLPENGTGRANMLIKGTWK